MGRDPSANYSSLLTVSDLQEILNVSPTTVYKLLQTGDIRSIRIGHKYRIPKRNLIDYLFPKNK